MSGTTRPGQSYSVTISPTNFANVTFTVGGVDVTPTATDNGNGTYTITFDASMVICPGPIVISEGTVTLDETKISPCP